MPSGRAEVVLVPPAYTTMTCSGCGARAKSRLLLSQRVFVCESCGNGAIATETPPESFWTGLVSTLPVLKLYTFGAP